MVAPGLASPLAAGLLGDPDVAEWLSDSAEIAAMVRFEAALAEAEAQHGLIPAPAAARITQALQGFSPDRAALAAAMARDGVVVPELVRQMRAAIAGPDAEYLHVGATSQDVVDTGLMLRLGPVLDILDRRAAEIIAAIENLSERFGAREMLGRTRMQAALPIRIGDRLASWQAPLDRHRQRLATLRPSLLVVQFGGAVGTLDRLGDEASSVRRALASRLGLGDAPQWHSQRDRIADLGAVLSALTGSLGKIGQDVLLMAQAGGEIVLSGGGGSSAMPHKKNPVTAEMLVALARFNAAQLGGLHQALVHEQERSGAAWALEWLILPQMLLAAGAATRIAGLLLADIAELGKR